jgi:RimJ/RimL family protein N-acetyltransferase
MGESRSERPFDIRPVTLEGRRVRLEPLSREHLDGIVEAGDHAEIWRWISVRPEGREGLERMVETALSARDAGTELPFTTVDVASGRIVGGTRYLNIDRPSRRLEIGWTWITPAMQRTYVNTEAKYLQLRHCFEVLGCRRVELKTDRRNEKSRNAMLRIGAQFEGIARFAIVDDDWPTVKARLEEMLERG